MDDDGERDLYRKRGVSMRSGDGEAKLQNPAIQAALSVEQGLRELLPERVILVRHGLSEANVDVEMYTKKPDNLIELAPEGKQEALEVGEKIWRVIGEEWPVDFFVSPFTRTLQTAEGILKAFPEGQVRERTIDPRIREQEFGNLQNEKHMRGGAYQDMKKMVGNFWYRYPEGESGADVYDRTKGWWDDAILHHNVREGLEPAKNVVVVMHSITMRLILMSIFKWAPSTFMTMDSVHNCEFWVLKKDLSIPGRAPYFIDPSEGGKPTSGMQVYVTMKNGTSAVEDDVTLKTKEGVRKPSEKIWLMDYLDIPPPRPYHLRVVKDMLHEQYPDIPVDEIAKVTSAWGDRFEFIDD